MFEIAVVAHATVASGVAHAPRLSPAGGQRKFAARPRRRGLVPRLRRRGSGPRTGDAAEQRSDEVDVDFGERYYLDMAVTFVRGRLPDLPAMEPLATVEAGLAQGLRLHKFKRTMDLARVRRVLGILRAIAPMEG